MEFTEKNLEDIIFNANKFNLSKKGLTIFGKLKRQVKIGNYGVCDLIEFNRPIYIENHFHDGAICITIYELKKNEINFESYSQILRYAKGVRSYFYKRRIDIDIRIVLIGRTICQNGGFPYLNQFSNVKCLTYHYDENGISFNENTYELIDEGF